MPSLIDRLLTAVWPELWNLRADVTALQLEVQDIMATQAQFNARMNAIDAATNEIAADLKKLRDELAGAGTISDANLAMLDEKIAALEILGRDPEQPVPPSE